MKNCLKDVRLEKGITQSELAELVNTSSVQISRLETGTRTLSETWIRRFAKALEVDPAKLLGLDGESEEIPQVPVVGYIGAGAEVLPIDDHAKGDGLYHVDAPPEAKAQGAVAVKVKGSSMLPVYREGDVLYYIREVDFDSSFIGKECIVKCTDGRAFVKVLKRGSQEGLFELRSYNDTDIEDIEIEWASPVLWVKKG